MLNLKRISTKIRLFSVLFGVLLVLQFATIISHSRQLESSLSAIGGRELAMVHSAYELRYDTVQVQQWFSDISATRGQDGLDDGLTVALKYHDLFTKSLGKLTQLDPVNAARYRSWREVFETYYQSGLKMARVYVDSGPAAGNRMMPDFDAAAEHINTLITKNLQHTTATLSATLRDNTAMVRGELQLLYLFGGLYATLFVLLVTGAQHWIGKPLRGLAAVISAMAKQQNSGHEQRSSGVDLSTLDQSQDTEVGQIGHSLACLLSGIEQHLQHTAGQAEENQRFRDALDNVNSSVMMADTDLDIVYVNKSAQALFDKASADLRSVLPHFDPQHLIGTNIDSFHKDPAHQRSLLATLDSTFSGEFEVGGRTLGVVANPVLTGAGTRLGTVVEWLDRTEEVALEKEIEEVVVAAQAGELNRRVNLDNKQGFVKALGQQINALLETSGTGINDTITVISAMAEGDLTRRIEADYRGAFGQLKHDTNSTTTKFSHVVSDIKSAADLVRQSALEITRGNMNLSSRTEQQAASLEETAASMEELTSTVKSNSDNASQASQLAAGARDKAVNGGEVVMQTVSAMKDINVSSNQIADIIGVIDEIAFQTNLLALNAAVEAARAGEQGRGFAVVATEVRNLAQRSAKAAKEIKDLIRDSVSKVEEGTRLVDASGVVLDEIVIAVKKVSDIVAEIASASVEQSAGIEDTNKAIMGMDEVTQKNAALVEEAAAASQILDEQATRMAGLVSFFRIDGDAAPRQVTPDATADEPDPLIEERRSASQRPWSQQHNNAGQTTDTPAQAKPVMAATTGNSGLDDEWEEF